MTAAELAIVHCFRSYEMRPGQMLFLSAINCRTPAHEFAAATKSLVASGFMTHERPASAFSLTKAGYEIASSLLPSIGRHSRRKVAW